MTILMSIIIYIKNNIQKRSIQAKNTLRRIYLHNDGKQRRKKLSKPPVFVLVQNPEME